MSDRVVVTGLGVVSACGSDTDSFWKSLLSGKPAIKPLPANLSEPNLQIGAMVDPFAPEQNFSRELLPMLDPFSQFSLAAAREAVRDAGLNIADKCLREAGVVIGTGCGSVHTFEDTYVKLYKENKTRVHPLTIPKGMASAPGALISMEFGLHGPCFTVSSACASGASAIAQGLLMLRSGITHMVLVGGTDAIFNYGMIKAWSSLRLTSNDTCRPFSKDRSGMVLGEGAGVLVLETETHARNRGARIYAELAGAGYSSDANHITTMDHASISRAIRGAMDDARLSVDAVQYINAHGTATATNDVNESRAITSVFGMHSKNIAVSSTKSMHGHALGASSAIELVACVLAIRDQVAPPTANFTERDPQCDLDFIPNTARDMKISGVLSNAFAFGGINVVLALKRYVDAVKFRE